MNNHFVVKSKNPWTQKSLFGLKRHKSRSWLDSHSAEYVPLASGNDYESDDELTIHDIEYLNIRQRAPAKSSSPIDIKRNSKLHSSEQGSQSDPYLQCDLVPLELNKNDTLQSISVKYNCPISDLKRANNLMNNQEFYGLSSLKIPVKKHGYLSELIQESQTVHMPEDNESRIINIGIGPMLSSSPPQEAAAFLRKMDEDLVRIMLKTKTQKDTLEEAAATLAAPMIKPLTKENPAESSLQFCYLLSCIIALVIIFPIIMIIYMYYFKPMGIQHNDTVSEDLPLMNKIITSR